MNVCFFAVLGFGRVWGGFRILRFQSFLSFAWGEEVGLGGWCLGFMSSR